MTDALRTLARIPLHLATVVIALVLALATDRVAAVMFLAGVALTLTIGWVAVGIVLALYAILLFAHQVVGAFLR
jgi:hypothetical protein